MGSDVHPRHDHQRLDESEGAPQKMSRLLFHRRTHFRCFDDPFDERVDDDVPGGRHGHRVSGWHSGSRLASGSILENLWEDGRRVVSDFHFVDPPVRTVSVHQPVVQYNNQVNHTGSINNK